MTKKCRPVKYASVSGSEVLYGFRCVHVPFSGYRSERARDEAMTDHKKQIKKLRKEGKS